MRITQFRSSGVISLAAMLAFFAGCFGSQNAQATLLVAPNYAANYQAADSAESMFDSPIREQTVYGASEFPPYPIIISEIQWRPDSYQGGPVTNADISSIQIDLSTTTNSADHLNSAFAQNTGTDDTVVFSGALALSTSFTTLSNGTMAFDEDIPLQTSFTYDPSKGNFLIELRNFSGSTTTIYDNSMGSSTDTVSRIWANDPDATSATLGDTGGGAIQITYTPAPLPPVVTNQPANQTVSIGGAATFLVSATGAPPLSYQWFFNDTSDPIAGATNSSLALADLQANQAGTYFVEVNNAFGPTFSSNAVLTVTAEPVITSQPAEQVTVPGGAATFSVVASSSEPLTYQWFFNNTNLIAGATNTSLTLTNVQFDQAGLYSVQVVNTYGSVVSSNASLAFGWVVPSASASNQVVNSDGSFNSVIREQNVFGGFDMPAYPIIISEVRFRPDQTVGGPFATTLPDIQLNLSTSQSQPGDLNTTFAANVGTNNTVVYSGSLSISTAFTTLSNGTKAFDIRVPLQTAFLYNPGQGNLLLDLRNFDSCTPAEPNFINILSGSPSSSRLYSVGNANGTTGFADGAGYVLEVIYTPAPVPPVITAEPTNETLAVGSTASFSVTASGAPTLTYQWYNGSGSITEATNSTLTLSDVQLSEAGTYYVTVSNPYSSTNSANATLTVTNPAPPGTGVPAISSFNPASAFPGASLTVNGTNFSATASSNIVYFGAVQAAVASASKSNLTVTLPFGATFAPITETVGGLTAESGNPFLPTFPGSSPLSSSSLGDMFNLALDNGPFGVAIGDLDGDGKPDLVVVNDYGSQIWIYRNIGTNGELSAASFAPPVILDAGSPIGAENIEVVRLADLTGDGRLDIVFANHNNSVVSVFQNLCSPGNITTNTFGPRLDFAVGAQPFSVAVADLDGDGKPELITGNYGDSTISVLRNVSTGGLLTTNSFASPMTFATPSDPSFVGAGDVDGDGKIDLVTANTGGGSTGVSIFDNTSTPGSISFAPRVDLADNVSQDETVAIGDMDGDGKQDLVVGSYTDSSFSVFRNIGTPGSITTNSFAAPVTFAAGGPLHQDGIALADLDGDGKLDVAAVDQNSGLLYLYRNVSTPGSFTSSSLAAPVTFTAGYNSATVAIGDLDADGRPDIVIANSYGHNLTLYKNINSLFAGPVISTEPTNETVAVGGTAGFSVTASGAPTLAYQWYNDSNSITGATNSTLTLSNVQLSAAGTYYVTVSNPYGSTNSANATLTVTNPAPPVTSVPAISSFNPASAFPGAGLRINGTNFSATASSNIVYFGAVQALVTGASTSSLTVIVPTNATFAPISVTVDGLTAYSEQPFLPTFPGLGPVTNSSFAPAFNLNTPAGPNRVLIADLDGDGKPDVIVADNYAGTVSIFQNLSTNGLLSAATFGPRVDLVVGNSGGGADPYTIAVADLDGDGKLDIVALNADSNIVSIFRNISTPGTLTSNSFAARIDLPGGNQMRGVAIQDLDGDGKPEIVVGNQNDNNISIFKNLSSIGNIAFAPRVDLAAGAGATTVVIGDLDGDGLPDIAVANYNAGTISVFRNLGFTGTITTSSFAPAVNFACPATPFGLALGDMDGDGKLDLVVGGAGESLTVAVLRNTSNPGSITTSSFAPAVDFAAPGWVNFVALADLDGSGKPDIALVTQLGNAFSVFKNTSTPGSFTASSLAPRLDFPAGYNPNGIAVGDLNGDGRPDVVFANSYDGTLSIYQNVVPFEGALPTITLQPMNQVTAPGGAATFSVAVSSTVPVGYQWFFNNTNLIAGATNSSLALTDVQYNQAGLYSVQVANTFGSVVSSNASLAFGWVVPTAYATNQTSGSDGSFNSVVREQTVYGAFDMPAYPIIISELRFRPDQGVGGPFATTLPDIQLNLSTSQSQPDHLNPTFAANVGSNNTVVYSGSLSISTAFTTLSNGTKAFDILLPLQTAFLYNPAQGNLLLDLQDFDGSTPAEPNFINCASGSPSASRLYSVGNANGTSGFADGAGYVLEVIYTPAPVPPVITAEPTNETLAVGSTASFSVTASGAPTLTYQWYNGSGSITEATNSTLTLSDVQLSEAGTYYVTVSNPYGSTNSANATLTVTNSSSSCTPPPSGIVAWWRAEGNFLDSVGTNNGTPLGALGFTNGEVGQAFDFVNSTQGVHVDASPSLTVQSLTIECWINPVDNTTARPIVEYGSDTGSSPVEMWYNYTTTNDSSPGALYGLFRDTNNVNYRVQTPAGLLPTNQWSHVALTFDNATQTGNMYLDGTNVASAVFSNLSIMPVTDVPVHLGYRSDTSAEAFAGRRHLGGLDEVSIYDRALSASEVADIYNASSAGKCFVPMAPTITAEPTNETVEAGGTASFSVGASGSPTLDYQWFNGSGSITGATNSTLTLSDVQLSAAGTYYVTVSNPYGSTNSVNASLTVTNGSSSCTPAPSGIVAWWKAEDNALDSVGTNNGTINGGVTYANGEVGQAFNFDGTTGFISVPASPSLNIGAGGGMTIEGWIRPNHLGPVGAAGRPIVEYDTSSAIGAQLWFEANSTLFANLTDTSGVNHEIESAPNTIVTNALQHVAVTYDKSSGNCFLYINGVQATNANFGSITPQTTYPLFLGERAAGGFPGSGSLYNGLLDELSLYSRALSPSEIAAIYTAGSAGKCFSGVAPAITAQPVNQNVQVNGTTSFFVGASGSPILMYQWFNGSQSITGATNSLLVLSNVQPSQAGTYYATVSNPYGTTNSASATLTANFMPATVQVVDTEPTPPGTNVVTVPIDLVANGNENTLSFSLSFDTNRLVYTFVVADQGASGATLTANTSQATDGQLGIEMTLPGGKAFSAGTHQIMDVYFSTPTLTGTQPVVTPISFTNEPVGELLTDTNGNPLPYNLLNGTVTLSPSTGTPNAINLQPTLTLSYGGSNSLLSWPAWAGDFSLEAAGSLTPPVTWTNVPAVMQTNGANVEVIVPTPGQQEFFRLYLP